MIVSYQTKNGTQIIMKTEIKNDLKILIYHINKRHLLSILTNKKWNADYYENKI